MADLEWEITHCPHVEAWFTTPATNNPCSGIIAHQGLTQQISALGAFQLPEPWQGHIDKARILFVSSNPSIDTTIVTPNPNLSFTPQAISRFYNGAFDCGGWIRDGKKFAFNGDWKVQPYWAGVKCRAAEILEKEEDQVVPGIDYALTEVVHCKSQGASGVPEAMQTCARMWLMRILDKSPARLIVVFGRKIPDVFNQVVGIPIAVPASWGLWGPGMVAGRQRYIAFMGHPCGPDPKTFEKCVNNPAQLAALRAFV